MTFYKFVKTFEQYSSDNIVNQYSSFSELSKLDLYDIAVWGLEGPYHLSGVWDDTDDIDEAAALIVDDFKRYLMKPYPKEFGNMPAEPVIYRLVRLKNVESLNLDNLGTSWYSDPKQTDNPEFFDMLDYLKRDINVDTEVYRIKGATTEDNIDVVNSLWQRSTQWWENEIVIKDPKQIKVIEVEKFHK